MAWLSRAGLLVSAAAALACAQTMPRGAVQLGGTAWTLAAIQSMDDAQGTTTIPDPSRFTLRFGHDGRVSLQLDCNRGFGTYQHTPSADGQSGSLRLGDIASTRALCAPPQLDQRVLRDLPFVRSYLLKDGQLFLSLMADGGIYQWKPLAP